jgi:three-Cys-motif partner protein
VGEQEDDFFSAKRAWSKEKDQLLDYYLKPYLAKVATLGPPILIIDCFAGPGRFEDDTDGSPMIIAKHIREAIQRGANVQGLFVEKNPIHHAQLETNLRSAGIPHRALLGSFRDYADEFATYSKNHSILFYVDPFKPSDLHADDLEDAFQQVRNGRSVEALITFMSTGFVRAASGAFGAWKASVPEGSRKAENLLVKQWVAQPEVQRWNDVAGGTHWQSILFDQHLEQSEKIDRVAAGYSSSFREKWFTHVINFPIKENYRDPQPKYHMVFASRHPDAVILMNDAMVKGRRIFLAKEFEEGQLFDNTPKKEVADPRQLEEAIQKVAIVGKCTRKDLIVRVISVKPAWANESEINKAIKAAIASGKLKSTASGTKLDDDALIWI